MGENLICPYTSICSIYNHQGEERLDIIKKNEENNYYCQASKGYSGYKLESFNPECALIKILNNEEEILTFVKPRESVGGPR